MYDVFLRKMQVHIKNRRRRFIIDLVPLHPHDSMPSSQTPLYLLPGTFQDRPTTPETAP
jgi:hypothetical protein